MFWVIRNCEKLWYLLQMIRDTETGELTLKPAIKDDILSPYYSKDQQQPLPFGYVSAAP